MVETTEVVNGFVCVECGATNQQIYHQYSVSVLKLINCKVCGALVDKYIEWDSVLVVQDILLQYLPAYRHLIYNRGFKNYWRLALIFIICDAYFKWIIMKSESTENEFLDLEWNFYISLLMAIFDTVTFITCAIVLCYSTSQKINVPLLIKALLAANYGQVLVVVAVVWSLHTSLSYLILTSSFIFMSQVQIIRVTTGFSLARAISYVSLSFSFQHICQMILSTINR